MNDINLLPDRLLFRKKKILRLTVYSIAGILAAALLFCGLFYRTYQRIELEKIVDELMSGIDDDALKELIEAELRLMQKQDELKNINKLINLLPKEKAKPTELFERLAQITPDGLDRVDFSLKRESGEVTMKYNSSDRKMISLLLKRLHDDKLYSDVNISAISGGEDSYSFTITMRLQ